MSLNVGTGGTEMQCEEGGLELRMEQLNNGADRSNQLRYFLGRPPEVAFTD
jgi:hypothetical protein